jgi:tetratricopeptide (TPR) repeat protein
MNFNFLFVQSTGIIRKSFPSVPGSLLMLVFFAGLGSLTKVQADGMFVAPKFVWDKHKDINEPTQKAIMVYDAGREDLILQVEYEGPVDEFGWLIPVPNLPTVQEGSMKCFYELSQYTQRHFEWRHQRSRTRSSAMTLGMDSAEAEPEPPVKVIETKIVGAYKIAVLSTKDAGALENWLATNHFYFPTNKTDVLDMYVKQHWYFVAVKVNLGQGLLGTISSKLKLAAGELHPLQISFASDHCVYPLKISSVNGQPSEVQVYVLSPEPLLEKAMLEKKLPTIYSNDLARAKESAERMEQMQIRQREMQRHIMGGNMSANPPLSAEMQKGIQKLSETPIADPGNLPPYAKVTKADLPDCSKAISRLADRSWWLTKQTWTFKPEEMRDLEFEPALSVFGDWLGAKYGYFAVEGLARFQADAVPALLAAFQNTNPIVRLNAASIFNRHYGTILDPRLTAAALTWLKDSEPEIRTAGISMLTEYPNWNPTNAELLVPMLRDPDRRVRHELAFALPRFRNELGNYFPVIYEMLKDKDLNIRVSAVEMLDRLSVPIPVEDLLPLFNVHDDLSLGLVGQALYHEEVFNDEIIPLLQNPEPSARMVALNIFSKNANKQSVELALPLLRDPDELVRLKAAQTLRELTGQNFNEDQADEWGKWWMTNKNQFISPFYTRAIRSYTRMIQDLPQNGRAYYDRGCFYYDTYQFTNALADFRKACELGSDAQDYSCFRIWLIRARLGEKDAATQELATYLEHRDAKKSNDWPLKVGHFLTGQLSEADFLEAAADTNAKTDQEQHCEAYFYAGMKHLLESDKTTAADYFKKCLATNVKYFGEYQSAEAELRRLASPAK